MKIEDIEADIKISALGFPRLNPVDGRLTGGTDTLGDIALGHTGIDQVSN